MSLFEVPGWSVPSAPVQESKKRKRPSRAADGDEKVRAVEVNLEKLVAKMDAISGSGEAKGPKKKKAKREGGADDGAADARPSGSAKEDKKGRKNNGEAKSGAGMNKKKRKEETKSDTSGPLQSESASPAVAPLSKKAKKAAQAQAVAKPGQPAATPDTKTAKSESKNAGVSKDLTALQSGMKNSLEGARFRCVSLLSQFTYTTSHRTIYSRWINEELYKSDSAHAHDMMRADPNVFHEVRSSPLRSAFSTSPPSAVPQGLQTPSRIMALEPRVALHRRTFRLPLQNSRRGSGVW